MMVSFMIGLIAYIVMAVALMKLANKAGMHAQAWWAWIPILNMVLFMKMVGKPEWWVILLFIPLVNIVIWVIATMAFSERFGHPSWVGLVMALLGLAPIYLLVVAFGSTNYHAVGAPAPATMPPATPPPAAPPAI